MKVKNFYEKYGNTPNIKVPNSSRSIGPTDFDDSYVSRQLKECSFVPEINENSKKMAKNIPKIYERKNSQNNFTERKNYENKSLYLSAKYNKSEKNICYSTSHKRIGDPDIELFRNQLRNNEIDNIHIRNEQWVQNRETKLYNELKQKNESQEAACSFVPKTNKKATKKIPGTFLERREFDIQKRKVNKTDLIEKSYSSCTFKPKIDPKSQKMAVKRHEMLAKLDYITSLNNDNSDYKMEVVPMTENRHCADHYPQESNHKSYVQLKPNDLISESDYDKEKSEHKYKNH